jgi:hypothetical protein
MNNAQVLTKVFFSPTGLRLKLESAGAAPVSNFIQRPQIVNIASQPSDNGMYNNTIFLMNGMTISCVCEIDVSELLFMVMDNRTTCWVRESEIDS